MKKTFIVEDVIQEVKLRLIKDAYILKKFIDLEFSKYIKEDALMHLTKIMKPNFDAFIEPYSVQMKVSLLKKEGSFTLECKITAVGEMSLEEIYSIDPNSKIDVEQGAISMENQAIDFFESTLYTQLQGIFINAQTSMIEVYLKSQPELKNNPDVLADNLLINSFGLPAVPIKFNRLFNIGEEYKL